MRHAVRSQRLSRPSDHRKALVDNLVKSLLHHGRIRTTYARAKEAQRLADRLISWGKQGSVHARRQAFRVLQDRSLVKRLFDDIAPTFNDLSGGYTRAVRLVARRGDGAQEALLTFSRLPRWYAQTGNGRGGPAAPSSPPPSQGPAASQEAKQEPPPSKGFLDGLRRLFKRTPWGGKDS